MQFFRFSPSGHPCNAPCEVDRGGGSVNNAHHIDLDRAVETELLRYARHFIGGKHYPKAEEHISRKLHKPKEQQSGLKECRKAYRRHLFAPLVEAVGVAPRYAEHIEASDSHLHKQYAAALDVLKEDLYNAVSEG